MFISGKITCETLLYWIRIGYRKEFQGRKLSYLFTLEHHGSHLCYSKVGTIVNGARNVEIFSEMMLWTIMESFSCHMLESKTYDQLAPMSFAITHLSLKRYPVQRKHCIFSIFSECFSVIQINYLEAMQITVNPAWTNSNTL